ncbi:hypothetical protein [Bradyrhizobium sp. SEMIA]|uniref:hypothetical protein n=1 Tax=Bradyrhizobium sp. SEMIA TaxID=2597515 RepID=UPI0022401218|nr:hypothetical protein [Bradyrhizobium sp. SEMIA]
MNRTVCAPMAGLVDATIDASAPMFDESTKQTRVRVTNGEVAIDQNCGFPDVLLGWPAADDSYDVACCSAKGTNENACRHGRELHEADLHLLWHLRSTSLRQRRRGDTGKGLQRSGISTIRIEQGSELSRAILTEGDSAALCLVCLPGKPNDDAFIQAFNGRFRAESQRRSVPPPCRRTEKEGDLAQTPQQKSP